MLPVTVSFDREAGLSENAPNNQRGVLCCPVVFFCQRWVLGCPVVSLSEMGALVILEKILDTKCLIFYFLQVEACSKDKGGRSLLFLNKENKLIEN